MSVSGILGLLFLLLLPLNFACGADSGRRMMVPDDLFRLQTIGTVAVSPAGDAVAYVVQRSISTSATFGRLYLWGNDRADIWVLPTISEGRPRNITNGERDGSGFWAPQWSPDGRWLAMLSTRGGNIRLWVWNKDRGTLELLSNSGVDPRPDTFAWVTGSKLVFWTLPAGQRVPSMGIDLETPEVTRTEWAKAIAGKTSTASVLESAGAARELGTDGQEGCQLLVTDLDTKKTEVVSSTAAYGEFAFATIRVAPDRRSIAFLKQTGILDPRSGARTVELLDANYALMVAHLDQGRPLVRMEGVRRPFWGSVRWSPDTTELAVIGLNEKLRSGEILFRCRVATGLCQQVTTEAFALRHQKKNIVTDPPYLWFGEHELAVRGEARMAGSDEMGERWKFTRDDGSLGDLPLATSDASQYPDRLFADNCSGGLIAASDRAIWKIKPDGVVAQRLASGLGKIINIEQMPSNERACSRLLFVGSDGGSQGSYLLDSRSWTFQKIIPPAPDARLVAVDGQQGSLVFVLDDDTGSYLWLGSSRTPSVRVLLATNRFLREIQPGELEEIEYSSLDGQPLKGWVILPPDFEPGHRYPVVAWVYAGTVYGHTPPGSLVRINEIHPLNLQLLAAHGYVVLMPSMPLPSSSLASDPYMELGKGVLPAIDKLVHMGIADPYRVAVMGQSYGGYSAYGLITQTNRFRAAIVLAGISDLVSLYGTFDPRTRYDSTGYRDSSLMWNVEGMGMGGPPWTGLDRYIRNSPITYVSRVQTPLLIIHGDLDYIPLQQGEEFFTALYRQGMRAEFIRYWGEDHLLSSPANIRDMWERIYKWLDTFLIAN